MAYAIDRPDVCIYHHPCSDGFTAAWAIWKRWPDIQFIPGAYNGAALPDVTGKHVLLVDFSYKHDQLLELVATAASVTILDHHKSAQADLQPLLDSEAIEGEFDMARSGAMMAFNSAFPGTMFNLWPASGQPIDHVPYLVQYVQDRDLWSWALPDSKEISAYIQLTPMTFGAWDKLAQELEDCDGYARAVSIGKALVRKQEAEIAGAIKSSKRRMKIDVYDVPVANMPYIWASEAGNILSKGEPFAATYFDSADGSRSFSLRSDKDDPNAVDVSQIAAYYGGGGHKNAAGFRAPAGWEGTT